MSIRSAFFCCSAEIKPALLQAEIKFAKFLEVFFFNNVTVAITGILDLETLRAVLMKVQAVWNVSQCRSVNTHRRFGSAYCFRLIGLEVHANSAF